MHKKGKGNYKMKKNYEEKIFFFKKIIKLENYIIHKQLESAKQVIYKKYKLKH